MSGLGAVLERLQGLFGKGYLIAGLLPALVFVAVSLLFGLWISPGARELTGAFAALQTADQALGWLALVFALALAGFVLWSLNPWLLRLLQGVVLPKPLQALLREGQLAELEKVEADLQRARNEVFDFRSEEAPWTQQLQAALQRGPEARAITELPASFNEARREVSALGEQSKRISFAKAKEVFERVLDALRGSPQVEVAYHLQRDFLARAKDLKEKAEAEQQRYRGLRLSLFPRSKADLQPTRMANLWKVDSDYPWLRYGMSIEVFWPHLQKLMQGEEKDYALLAEAQVKLAFATAMTVMLGGAALIWWPLALTVGSTPAMYAAVGVLIVATFIFYGVTRYASAGYGSAVRSAIDLYRFGVLRALHVPLPEDSQKERELWQTLTAQSELVDTSSIVTYQHGEDRREAPDEDPGKSADPGLWRRLLAAVRG